MPAPQLEMVSGQRAVDTMSAESTDRASHLLKRELHAVAARLHAVAEVPMATSSAGEFLDTAHRIQHQELARLSAQRPARGRRKMQGGGQPMNVLRGAVRLPSANDSIAPVRLLDADGRLVCVVSAEEFRRTHPTIDTTDSTPTAHHRRPPDRPRPRSVPPPQAHASVRPAARPIASTEAVTLERVE